MIARGFAGVGEQFTSVNSSRLYIDLHVEGEPVWLAAQGHHLVHGRHRRLVYHHRPSRRICAEDKVVGERHTPSGSCDVD